MTSAGSGMSRGPYDVELQENAVTKSEYVKEMNGFGKSLTRIKFSADDDPYYIMGSTSEWPVIVFALTEDKKVIAVRQKRFGAKKQLLELPGGGPEGTDVTRVETVLRELQEETDYTTDPAHVHYLDKALWFDPVSCSVAYHPYLATECRLEPLPREEPSEADAVELVPIAKWIEALRCGEPTGESDGRRTSARGERWCVTDSKTIATSFLALFRLGCLCTRTIK